MPCSSGGNPFQKWAGETFRVTGGVSVASSVTNAATPGYCLGAEETDPVTMSECGGSVETAGAEFVYNHSSRSLGVAGINRCLNINHNTGPVNACSTGNTKGYSSTYLAMGFANVRAGTQKRVSFCLAAGRMSTLSAVPLPASLPRVSKHDGSSTGTHAPASCDPCSSRTSASH